MKILSKIKSLLFKVSLIPILFIPNFVHAEVYKGLGAQGATKSLTQIQEAGGASSNTTLPTLIGGLIGALLGILGLILVIYIIQAGIMYMTAAGDPAKVDKAKKMITQAIIGMIIIVSAYAISSFVIDMLVKSTSGTLAPVVL